MLETCWILKFYSIHDVAFGSNLGLHSASHLFSMSLDFLWSLMFLFSAAIVVVISMKRRNNLALTSRNLSL